MKIHRSFLVPLSATLLASSSLFAADTAFIPRILGGAMDYSFDANLKSNAFFATGDRGFDISDTVAFYGLGGTFAADRYFIDVLYQRSTQGSDEADITRYIVNPANDAIFVNEVDFRREDFALSLGYEINESFSIFAGYKIGKTGFDRKFIGIYDNGNSFASNQESFEFNQNGPFIGAAYGWYIGPGRLAATVAIARLAAHGEEPLFSGCRPATPPGTCDGFVTVKYTGSSIGASVGISWKAPITERLSYGLTLNGQQYNFDVDNGRIHNPDGSFTDGDVSGDFKETVLWGGAALTYRF